MSGRTRLAYFSSALWVLVIAAICGTDYRYNWTTLFFVGIFPLFVLWGLKWVFDGFGISPISKLLSWLFDAERAGSPQSQLGILKYSPWRRFFAKPIDSVIFGFLPAVIFFAIFSSAHHVFAYPVVILSCVLLDSACLTLFGQTPGRLIFGLEIESIDGESATFQRYLYRSAGMWFSGYGLGLPLISLFTLARSYNHLVATGVTEWDRQNGFRVKSKPISRARIALAITASFAISMTLQVLDKLAYQEEKPKIWTNPVTQKQIRLPGGIKIMPLNSETDSVKGAFSSDPNDNYVRLLVEAIDIDQPAEILLERYAIALKQSYDQKMRSPTSDRRVQLTEKYGFRAFQFESDTQDSNYKMSVIVWTKDGKKFWHVQSTLPRSVSEESRVHGGTIQALYGGT